MSLKAFHVFFVTVSIILAFGFGIWATRDYQSSGTTASLVMAVLSFLGGVALLAYFPYFLRKTKNQGYL